MDSSSEPIEDTSHQDQPATETIPAAATPATPATAPKKRRGRPPGSGTKMLKNVVQNGAAATSDMEDDMERSAIKKLLLKKKIKKYIRFYLDKEDKQRVKPGYYNPPPSLYQQEMNDVEMEEVESNDEAQEADVEESNDDEPPTNHYATPRDTHHGYKNPPRTAQTTNRYRSLIFRH